MIDKLDISNVALFKDRDAIFQKLQQKTFIYGKNGTGKSTLARLIKEQAKDQEVFVFQGFESVVSRDNRLNTLTLGTENTELKPLIDNLKNDIKNIDDELNPDIEGGFESSFRIVEKKNKKIEKELNKFYSETAAQLKTENQDIINNVNYNKNTFIEDLKTAQKIENAATISELKNTVNQKQLSVVDDISLPDTDLSLYFAEAKEIVETSVSEKAILKFQSSEERNWVREGVKLHQVDDSSSDICLFCGSELSQNRLNDLNSYFGDELKNFENRIDNETKQLEKEIKKYKAIPNLDTNTFYPKFVNEINELNNAINVLKLETNDFLEGLYNAIIEKKKNPFESQNISIETFEDKWGSLSQSIGEVISENNNYSSQLNLERNQARNKLRMHLVYEKSEDENYKQLLEKQQEVQNEFSEKEKQRNLKESQRRKEREKLEELVKKTKDESIAANRINARLKNVGNTSFQLLVDDSDDQGSYIVQDSKGDQREVSELSTGELNLIGFLYFVLKIEENTTPKIIIFDDPMNSNDDTNQYLIIAELNRLIKELDSQNQLFIMTHNTHFYINVRYGWWKKNMSDKLTIHLYKSGDVSDVVKITNANDDLKTSYDGLWSELEWLYQEGKPEYMLNTIRRIFETFTKFEGVSTRDFYEGFPEAEKLFNVNSHSIDDLEADLNGKTAKNLIDVVRSVFEKNNALNHFNKHWTFDV